MTSIALQALAIRLIDCAKSYINKTSKNQQQQQSEHKTINTLYTKESGN